ncbi:CA-responsive protein, partial [Striga asiatica]
KRKKQKRTISDKRRDPLSFLPMAATPVVLLITLPSDNPPPPQPSLHQITLLSPFPFLMFLTFSVLIFTLCAIWKSSSRVSGGEEQRSPVKIESLALNDDGKADPQQKREKGCEPGPENLARLLLLEILPSGSTKWDTLFSDREEFGDGPGGEIRSGQEEEEEEKKVRRKRARKKKPGPNEEERKDKEEFVCLYPFTKSCSVGQFVNCLVEARNELQNKSEVIKRKFTIIKALLFKADRSSFDRLRQQIYKLELEQKRLEEDAFVYNWLQEQFKASPAYKKMLEISACMETKAKSSSLGKSTDDEFCDISFEELLAQEKKDAFWQRNGKLKSCSG